MRKSGFALLGLGFALAAGSAQQAQAQYCSVSTGNNAICTNTYEFINNVTVGGLNDTRACTSQSYEDNTTLSATIAAGQTVPASITIGSYWGADEVTIFIDWDNNGTLDDAGEAFVVTTGGGTGTGGGSATFNTNITAPGNAAIGAHRMRVWLTYAITPTPCLAGQTYGQIKDYTINVVAADNPQITGVPASGSVGSTVLLTAIATPGNNPASTSLTVTGDLSAVGGSSTQAFYDDGTHGDATAGDHTYSYLASIPHAPAQTAGVFGVPVAIVDNLARSGAGSISLTLTDEAIGGCCTGSSCSIATAFNCAGGGGHYLGDNTNCQGGPNHNFTSDPNIPIPDAGAPVSDTINVPDTFTVAQVTVRVTIPDHTFIGDLTIDLSNGANTVRVWDRQCGGDNGMDVTFDDNGALVICAEPTVGTYAPANSLGAFNSSPANGGWTIIVQDNAGADVGTLTHWELNLHEPVSCGPRCGTADFNCDGDIGTDADINSFFACLSGNCPSAPCTNSADFNGDGDIGTDADIDAFFRVLSGGTC